MSPQWAWVNAIVTVSPHLHDIPCVDNVKGNQDAFTEAMEANCAVTDTHTSVSPTVVLQLCLYSGNPVCTTESLEPSKPAKAYVFMCSKIIYMSWRSTLHYYKPNFSIASLIRHRGYFQGYKFCELSLTLGRRVTVVVLCVINPRRMREGYGTWFVIRCPSSCREQRSLLRSGKVMAW